MCSIIANKMIAFMIKNGIIKEEEQEIYNYGIQTIIASLANIVIILLIGVIVGYGLETLIFMMCYCPLRQFVGGYHASTYFKCLLTFIGVYIFTLFIFKMTQGQLHSIHIAVILLACFLLVLFIAPVENRNKPLEDEEKQQYKKKGILILCVEAVIIILLLASGEHIVRYCVFGTLAIVWVTVLMLLGFIKNVLGKKKGV